MDPMDFTMDDGQGSQQHNHAANQYHCQGSLPYYRPNGNQSPRGMAVRGEGQHYDPVHDNSGPAWYHGGSSIPNNPQAHISYPHSEHTFGGTYHNQYAPIHDNPHMRNLAYQYMGGHEGVGSSAWMDRASHQNQYPHTAYYNYPSTMMNANSNPNGQNPPISQTPTTLGNHNPHLMAQRQEYQASQVNQENIRNRVSGSFSGVPAPPVSQEQPRVQQQPRAVQQRPISSSGGGSHYASASSRPTFPFERSETTSLRNERAIAAHHRATLAAATAVTARSRALRASAGYSDDDDDDDLSPGNSPAGRYRHADHYLFAAEHQDERMMAAVRGAMSEAMSAAEREKVKVPSKAALASMVKLTLDEVKADHKEKELFCIICYNNFGEANPEGIIENILMLPKCKHIFGHICIKEWFLNHDTCPYCRDQLPSESSHRRSAAIEQYRILQERNNHNDQSRLALARARSTLAYRSAAADASASATFAAAGENNASQGAVESLFAPHSRSFSNESPGRRPNRERPNGRPNQPVFSRTIPAGSARPQRVVHIPGAPVMTGTHPSFTGSPYRAIPTGPSNGSSSLPTNQISAPLGHGVASEASPAVADGSFISAGDHMAIAPVFTPAVSADLNQPRHASSSTPVFSATTRPSLNFGAVDQQNISAPTSGNITRETMNSANVSPASHSGSDPARYAARSQPNGNAPPLPLPPNFRPRWTR